MKKGGIGLLKGIAVIIVLMMSCSFYVDTTFANQLSHTETLETVIKEKILQDGNDIESSINVKLIGFEKVPQKNYYTALFTFKSHSTNYLGEASFIKENDNYQYAGGHGYGVNRINQTTITVDNQLYFVIYGENFNKRISSINAKLANKAIKYDINSVNSPYFVHFRKLPSLNIKDVYPTDITCFDQKHHKLTWHECAKES